MTKRREGEDLRAAARLLVEATLGVTSVVEAMHRNISRTRTSSPSYKMVKGLTTLTGAMLDLVFAQAAPLFPERVPGPSRLAFLSALNGVLGDHLRDSHNPLALGMSFCRNGRVLALNSEALRAEVPQGSKRLLVLVHGSSMNDLQWLRKGHDHGEQLEHELGFTTLRLRYNTGRNISTNGAELANLLDELVTQWPYKVSQLVLLGHSMGGLVSRSACDFGKRNQQPWRALLTHLICLGAPHHGAALEQAGNWLEFLLRLSPYSAPLAALGKLRSAGVTDLRYGNVRDEDWTGRDRFQKSKDRRRSLPLPGDVQCFAVAGTKSLKGGSRLRSDGLVSVKSALGQHDGTRSLKFKEAHQFIAFNTDHVGLLGSPEVYAKLRSWLA